MSHREGRGHPWLLPASNPSGDPRRTQGTPAHAAAHPPRTRDRLQGFSDDYFCMAWRTQSGFFYETRLEANRNPIDATGNLVVIVHKTDRFRFCPALEYLRGSLKGKIFYQNHTIAILQHISVGVLHYTHCVRLGFAGLFMPGN